MSWWDKAKDTADKAKGFGTGAVIGVTVGSSVVTGSPLGNDFGRAVDTDGGAATSNSIQSEGETSRQVDHGGPEQTTSQSK